MNRYELHEFYKALRGSPVYRKDQEEWSKIGDDGLWEAKRKELCKKYGVKKLPTGLNNPREKIWPVQRTPKGKYSLLERCYGARVEGIREEDPAEVKQDFAKYQEYRKEKQRWEIPLSPEALSRLEGYRDAGNWEGRENALAEIIKVWAMGQSESVARMLKPDPRRLEWLQKMARPWEKGGLGLPFSEKYPFGIYFLTVNVLAQLYGTRTDVMSVILSQVSTSYPKLLEKMNLTDKELNHIFEQEKGYQGVIEYLAQKAANHIENLEHYIQKSLKHHFWETGQDKKKTVSILESRHEEETENEDLPSLDEKLYNKSVFVRESSRDAENTLALDDLNQKFQKHFASLPPRQKEVALMTAEGLKQEQIAAVLKVDKKTIQRDLKSLQENPHLQEIHKDQKEADYGRQVSEINPHKWVKHKKKNIKCPQCGVQVPLYESNPECPFCHTEITAENFFP